MNFNNVFYPVMVCFQLLGASCGSYQQPSSVLKRSVSQETEREFGRLLDLSREVGIDGYQDQLTTADKMNWKRVYTDTNAVGANIGASFESQVGQSPITINVGAEFGNSFLYKTVTMIQATAARVSDADGTDSNHSILDGYNNINQGRYVFCKLGKSFIQTNSFSSGFSAGVGISSFISAGGSFQKDISTENEFDFSLQKGFYKTKTAISPARLLDFCNDVGKKDLAFKNADELAEVGVIKFSNTQQLEDIARKVKSGIRVHDFLFVSQKMDIEKIESHYDPKDRVGLIRYIFSPHTKGIAPTNPSLVVGVSYDKNKSDGSNDEVVIKGVSVRCLNYLCIDTFKDGNISTWGGGKGTTKESIDLIKLLASVLTSYEFNKSN